MPKVVHVISINDTIIFLLSILYSNYSILLKAGGADLTTFWAGYWDPDLSGYMRDVNTGEPLGDYQPWWYGEQTEQSIYVC